VKERFKESSGSRTGNAISVGSIPAARSDAGA